MKKWHCSLVILLVICSSGCNWVDSTGVQVDDLADLPDQELPNQLIGESESTTLVATGESLRADTQPCTSANTNKLGLIDTALDIDCPSEMYALEFPNSATVVLPDEDTQLIVAYRTIEGARRCFLHTQVHCTKYPYWGNDNAKEIAFASTGCANIYENLRAGGKNSERHCTGQN